MIRREPRSGFVRSVVSPRPPWGPCTLLAHLLMSQVLCDLAVDQDSPGVVSSGDVSFSVGIVLLDLSIRTVL